MASKFLALAKLLPRNRALTAAASPSAPPQLPTTTLCGTRPPEKEKTVVGRMNHPFLEKGLGSMGDIEEYEREAIVNIDMPGIGKEGLSIHIRKNAIHIEAKAEKEYEDEDDKRVRTFSGVLDLPPGFYNTDQIKASMRLGVLRMVIPKLVPTFRDVPAIEFRGWGPMYVDYIPTVR